MEIGWAPMHQLHIFWYIAQVFETIKQKFANLKNTSNTPDKKVKNT